MINVAFQRDALEKRYIKCLQKQALSVPQFWKITEN